MLPYFTIFNHAYPSYGVMIILGIVVANLCALYLIRRQSIDADSFILLEAYGFLGGAVGAKLLYIVISFRDIEWTKLTDLSYLNEWLQSGFVFYGGLIGGFLALILGGLHDKINVKEYLRKFIFMLPLMHGFGRIGCFLAGCCFGIPYHGIFAVTYPEGSPAPSDVSLFPVQLLEAVVLLILAMILFYLSLHHRDAHAVEVYLIVYGTARFLLEFLRYDEVRGIWGPFSTSQWISIVLVVVGVLLFIKRN